MFIIGAPDSFREFLTLVQRMRAAQTDYRSDQSETNKARMENLEGSVDHYLQACFERSENYFG